MALINIIDHSDLIVYLMQARKLYSLNNGPEIRRL